MQSMAVETVPHLRTSASTRATEPRLSLPTDVERFTDDDELPGDNVLPGFWVPIAELFEEPQGGKT
jgi:hypothetical protein